MQKAEELVKAHGLDDTARMKAKVLVTEFVPDHMFRCIKTTMSWSGTAWQVSNVERLLNQGDEVVGEKLLLED
jgi:fatty acid-binding protein DegV